MRTKKPVCVSFPPEKMEVFRGLVNKERRSDAATLRVMLEDYMNGSLVPEFAEKPKKPKPERGTVSVSLDADFKERLYKDLDDKGFGLQKLVEGLIATKLKGTPKC